MATKWLLVAVVSALPAGVTAADVPPVPEPVCVYNCGTYIPPTNTGPTPEQLRQQRETEDLQEAAEDAVDKGDDAYKAGHFDAAVDWYTKALKYDADNQEARDKLEEAREKARIAKAERDRNAREAAAQTHAVNTDIASAPSFPPSAAELINAMNAAAARLKLPKSKASRQRTAVSKLPAFAGRSVTNLQSKVSCLGKISSRQMTTRTRL